MSVDVIKPVYKTTLGNPTAKSVLVKIAEHSNDAGYSFPSIETIAKQTEYSTRQVLRVIQVFREIGLLEKIKCVAKKYRYAFQINMTMLEKDLTDEFALAFQKAQKGKCLTDSDTETQNTVSQTQKSVSQTIPPHPLIGVTVKEPSRNKGERGDFTLTPPKNEEGFILPVWISEEVWDGFVEMRKKIKKPLTDRAITAAINKLAAFRDEGYSADMILDEATMNCWQGLWIPKGPDGLPVKPVKPKKRYIQGNPNNPNDWLAAQLPMDTTGDC